MRLMISIGIGKLIDMEDSKLTKEWIQEKSDFTNNNDEEKPVVSLLSRRVDRLEKMLEDAMEAIVQLNEKVISTYEK